MLSYETFFFAATGSAPFPYQKRLAFAPELPNLIDIPTGMGKTAGTVIAWLWRYYIGEGVEGYPPQVVRQATPRRLVYCLPMRSLVEQTQVCAQTWVENLCQAGYIDKNKAPGIYVMMGGTLQQDWDIHPEKAAIVIGTQDQLLSRALNRGYAMSRYRWPTQFGLLNNDCLWVIDEVQLFGAGLPTTAQLQAFREEFSTYGTAHSLWMSATLTPAWLATVDFAEKIRDSQPFRLDEQDKLCPPIARRIEAYKPLERASTALNKNSLKNYGEVLGKEVMEAHRSGSLTLVVLNRVDRAQALFKSLKKCVSKLKSAPELLLIHSRFRPAERRSISERMFSSMPAMGRIMVATQVVEAGVDISAKTLFTELAPWSSVVQRFGRANRRGEFSDTRIFWIDVDTEGLAEDHCRPYSIEELTASRQLLEKLNYASPSTLPAMAIPMKPASILRRRDLLDLFDTTTDLAGNDLDISRFVRDSDNIDIHVFWRDWQDNEPPPATLSAASEAELCSVPVYAFKAFMGKNHDVNAWRWDQLNGKWQITRREQVMPGHEYLMHLSAGGYDPELGWDNTSTSHVPAIKQQTTMLETIESDPFCNRDWLTLANHTSDVVSKIRGLATALAGHSLPLAELEGAARWHDVGKAHPLFQEFLLGDAIQEMNDTLWAKSPSTLARHRRPYFRHELASGIAALLNGRSNLIAYLAAAHHGKVRLSIRSLPGEKTPPNKLTRFARGVWDGDVLAAADLGEDTTMPETVLDLGFMELGENKYGPSWLARAIGLRDNFGPFKLAYLEALIKAADELASSGVAS